MTAVSSVIRHMETITIIMGMVRSSYLSRAKYNILQLEGIANHHPGGHDSRLALLSHHLLANARVLDVGCNEGWVSCEIGAFMHLSLS